jgi:hypothetical protein
MQIYSPHNSRYRLKWTTPNLDLFYEEDLIGRTQASGLAEAKKIFDVVVQGKAPFQDVVRFNDATKGMIGADLSAMSYSKDRRQILHNGKFFAEA